MNGSRLLRSLLEILSSQVVASMGQIATFIQSTLIYQLTRKKFCYRCKDSVLANKKIFNLEGQRDEIRDSPDSLEKLQDPENLSLFQKFRSTFRMENFVKLHQKMD